MFFLLLDATAGLADTFVKLPSKEQLPVQISGAKNFGAETLFDQEIAVSAGATAGDALGKVADLDMSGDYIETIDGIRGDQKTYWFYYINGLMANTFAYGYQLQPGDVEYWDFHDWTFYSMGPSAYLGAFPEPCLHGYGGKVAPTVVVCTADFQHEAGLLRDRLTALGVAGVLVEGPQALTVDEKEHDNILIIATAGQPLIASLNEQLKAHGTLYFSGGQIMVRGLTGKDGQAFGPGYGVLDVIQNPWDPRGSWACGSAVWAVTGLDATGVRRAARVLAGFPDGLRHVFALVVGKGMVIESPLGPGAAVTVAMNTETDPSTADIERGLTAAVLPVAAPDNAAAGPAAWLARYWWALLVAVAAAIVAGHLIRRRRNQKADQPAEEQELI